MGQSFIIYPMGHKQIYMLMLLSVLLEEWFQTSRPPLIVMEMVTQITGGSGTPGSSLWSENGTDIYYNTGNVGIGNDAPTSLLHITTAAATDKGLTIESGGNTNFQVMGDGRVFAREVEVTLANFPDYVFAKDYYLMPLGELKKYIETNHHLPNIPSAKEVEEKRHGHRRTQLKTSRKN